MNEPAWPIDGPCDHCPVPAGVLCRAFRSPIVCRIAEDPAQHDRVRAMAGAVVLKSSRPPASVRDEPTVGVTPRQKGLDNFRRRLALIRICPSWRKRHDCGCGVNGCLAGGLHGDGKTTSRECLGCQDLNGWWGMLPVRQPQLPAPPDPA